MVRRSRRLRASNVIALLVALAMAALLLAACGSPSAKGTSAAPPTVKASTSPAAATTKTVVFNPTTAAVSAAAPVPGSCWTTSIAAPAQDAYRCLSKNQILDPCFGPTVSAGQPVVTCFANPWTAGVRLSLSEALPKADVTGSSPWAFQLANGARCVSLTGTVRQVGSVDLTYRCGAAGSAGLIRPLKAGAPQSVEYAATATSGLVQTDVQTVWKG